jgi:D-lactate dehydrogenase (cytochrome)
MTIDTALAPLQALLGDRFSRTRADRDHHSRSESHFPPIAPDAVVWPLSTEEVAAIVRICADHDCPLIGWGGGTSLEGHGLAVRGGVTVDFTRMDRILEVNAEDMDVRVQPGVTREALNEALRATGLFFPVDPGANATLGRDGDDPGERHHGRPLWHDARQCPRAGGGAGRWPGDPHRKSCPQILDRV